MLEDRREKILVVATRFPFPVNRGDRLRLNNILNILAERYEIDLVCITTDCIREKDLEDANSVLSTVNIFQVRKNFRWYLRFLLKGFSLPFQTIYFYNSDAHQFIRDRCTDYNWCLLSLIRGWVYLEPTRVPIVLDMCDLLSVGFRKYCSSEKNIIRKFFYYWESAKLRAAEKASTERARLVLLANKTESQLLPKSANVRCFPNGVKPHLLKIPLCSGFDSYLCFIGEMTYKPNIDAIEWFADKVYPFIPDTIKLLIIGNYERENFSNIVNGNNRIEFNGYVDDPYSIMSKSVAIIAPMMSGTGIQNKVLEGLALGRPVVTTSLVARNIDGARDGENIFIADSPRDFAIAIHGILNEFGEAMRVGVKGRGLIRQKYTWHTRRCELLELLTHI